MDELKTLVTLFIAVHAAEAFLHEGRVKWSCKSEWKEAATLAKIKLFLKLVGWAAIKFAPFIYYSFVFYDHL